MPFKAFEQITCPPTKHPVFIQLYNTASLLSTFISAVCFAFNQPHLHVTPCALQLYSSLTRMSGVAFKLKLEFNCDCNAFYDVSTLIICLKEVPPSLLEKKLIDDHQSVPP